MLLSFTYLLFISFFFLPFFPYSSSSIGCSICLISFEFMYLWKLEYRLWRMYFCTDINGTATSPACVCTFVCSPGLLFFTAFSHCAVFSHPPATGASSAAPSLGTPGCAVTDRGSLKLVSVIPLVTPGLLVPGNIHTHVHYITPVPC